MKSLIRIATVAAIVAVGLAFASTSFAKEKGEKAAKPAAHVFTGVIDSIDATGNTLAVKKGDESKTFSVNGDTKISTADKKEAALADLKAGDKVMVSFVETDGKLVAKKIGVAAAGKKEKKK